MHNTPEFGRFVARIARISIGGEPRHMSKVHRLRSFANVMLLPVLTFFAFIGGWEAIVACSASADRVAGAVGDRAGVQRRSVEAAIFVWHLAVTMYEILAGFMLAHYRDCCWDSSLHWCRSRAHSLSVHRRVPDRAEGRDRDIVIWFGYGVSSKIVITAMIAFFRCSPTPSWDLRATPHDQIEMLVSARRHAGRCSSWSGSSRHALHLRRVDVAIVLAVIGGHRREFVGAKCRSRLPDSARRISISIWPERSRFSSSCPRSVVGLHAIVSLLRRRVGSGWTRRRPGDGCVISTITSPTNQGDRRCQTRSVPQASTRCRSST